MTSKTVLDSKIRRNSNKIYLLIIIFLVVLSIIIIFKTDVFSVKKVIVLNNYQIPNDEIISYSGILMGQNIFKIKLSVIQNKLMKHPFIKDVSIKRNLPNEIVINIVERKKVAAISYMGIYLYIDKDGFVLKNISEIEDELVIEGFEVNSFVEGYQINVENNKAFETALELSVLINNIDLDFTPKIYYNNGIIELFINKDFKAKFEESTNIEKKFNIFINILDDLRSKNIYNGIIDLSHNGYPIYRPFGE